MKFRQIIFELGPELGVRDIVDIARDAMAVMHGQAAARTPQEQMPAAGAESQPSSEPDSSPLVPAPSPTPAPVAPAEVVQQAPPEQAIWQRVESWADAWAGQRADSYISFYAADFVPAGGGSRAEWEALRRRRLAAPEYIKISLALLGVEQPGAEAALPDREP